MISIAIVGAVSAGKSTLVNTLFENHFSDMNIKRYGQLNEEAKLDYFDTFNEFIKGQVVKDYFSVPPYGQSISELPRERYYGDGIECENGYKMITFGGGCSGEDCNTSFIIDDQGVLVARNDW